MVAMYLISIQLASSLYIIISVILQIMNIPVKELIGLKSLLLSTPKHNAIHVFIEKNMKEL